MISDLSDQFFSEYRPDFVWNRRESTGDKLRGNNLAARFIDEVGGMSFNSGLYRLHHERNSAIWSKTVSAFFGISGSIICFGYDWLGRQFAVKDELISTGGIIVCDAELNKVDEIKSDLLAFHNVLLLQDADTLVARTQFRNWIARKKQPLSTTDCVGYEVPLVLGGTDSLENRERVDMEVYWDLCAQIHDQVAPLEEGTRIDRITVSKA